MNNNWLDSHAHLCEDEILLEIDDIIERTKENGLSRVLTIALDLEQYEIALNLQRKYPMIDIALGFHPENADDITEQDFKQLEEIAKSKTIVAIGEIGLDHYWRKDNKERQREVFIRQIEIANRANLPISIHSREASQELYQILKEYEVIEKGVLHCYSGSAEMAIEYMKLGYTVSFAGPITFKNAVTSKLAAEVVPLDKILIETDTPFLTPTPFRGKKNEPSYVVYTAKEICEIKQISELELQEAVQQNYQRLFLENKVI